MSSIAVIIPAFNEENSIASVLNELPKNSIDHLIVVDNNSNDNTAKIARENGATVVRENRKGYGSACLKGISTILENKWNPDIVVFIDADYSDFPNEMPLLTKKIEEGYDMVIGSRKKELRENGSMMPQQLFGNWLAVKLIRLLHGYRYYDLGPFRAIRFDKLIALQMRDTTYGWTVEMQVKAIKAKLRIAEIPVHYRKRIGHSKISGTVKGTILAGYKIIKTIIRHR